MTFNRRRGELKGSLSALPRFTSWLHHDQKTNLLNLTHTTPRRQRVAVLPARKPGAPPGARSPRSWRNPCGKPAFPLGWLTEGSSCHQLTDEGGLLTSGDLSCWGGGEKFVCRERHQSHDGGNILPARELHSPEAKVGRRLGAGGPHSSGVRALTVWPHSKRRRISIFPRQRQRNYAGGTRRVLYRPRRTLIMAPTHITHHGT